MAQRRAWGKATDVRPWTYGTASDSRTMRQMFAGTENRKRRLIEVGRTTRRKLMPSFGQMMTVGILCAVSGAAAMGANGSTRAAAMAAPLRSIMLSTSAARVHTSSNATLRIGLEGARFLSESTTPAGFELTVQVTTGKKLDTQPQMDAAHAVRQPVDRVRQADNGDAVHAVETHYWTFHLSHAAAAMSEETGSFSLKTASQISPFGTIRMRFTPKSSRQGRCATGSSKVFTGMLSGTIHFNTMSKAWGEVGSLHSTFVFPGGTTVTFDHQCAPPLRPAACSNGFSWSSPEVDIKRGGTVVGHRFFFGSSTKPVNKARVGTISAKEFFQLARPAGAGRIDELTDTTASQTYEKSTHTATIIPFRGRKPVFTGQAAVVSDDVSDGTSKFACSGGPKGENEVYRSFFDIQWKNAAHNSLTGHFATLGAGSVPDGGTAELSLFFHTGP